MTKVCSSCEHIRPDWTFGDPATSYRYARCAKLLAADPMDLIHPALAPKQQRYCEVARMLGGGCGPDGRLFQWRDERTESDRAMDADEAAQGKVRA